MGNKISTANPAPTPSRPSKDCRKLIASLNDLGWIAVSRPFVRRDSAVSPFSMAFTIATLASAADVIPLMHLGNRLGLQTDNNMLSTTRELLGILRERLKPGGYGGQQWGLNRIDLLLAEKPDDIRKAYRELLGQMDVYLLPMPPVEQRDPAIATEGRDVDVRGREAPYVYPDPYRDDDTEDSGDTAEREELEPDAEQYRAALNALTAEEQATVNSLLGGLKLDRCNMATASYMELRAPWVTPFSETRTEEARFYKDGVLYYMRKFMVSYGVMLPVQQHPMYTAVRIPFDCPEWSNLCLIAYLPVRGVSFDDMARHWRTMTTNVKKKEPPFENTEIGKFAFPRLQWQRRVNLKWVFGGLYQKPLTFNLPEINDTNKGFTRMVHSVSLTINETGGENPTIPEQPKDPPALPPWDDLTKDAPPAIPLPGERVYIDQLTFNRPFAFSIMAQDIGLSLVTGVYYGDHGEGSSNP